MCVIVTYHTRVPHSQPMCVIVTYHTRVPHSQPRTLLTRHRVLGRAGHSKAKYSARTTECGARNPQLTTLVVCSLTRGGSLPVLHKSPDDPTGGPMGKQICSLINTFVVCYTTASLHRLQSRSFLPRRGAAAKTGGVFGMNIDG